MTPPISHSLPNFAIEPQSVPLLQMPLDIFVQILVRLPAEQIGTNSLVCRQWNQMLKNDDVWRALLDNHFLRIYPNAIRNLREPYQAYSNLINGVYASHTLGNNTASAPAGLAYAEGKLFSSSCKNRIEVWDIQGGECSTILVDCPQEINSLALAGEKVFSGSFDGKVRVWDIKTGEEITILESPHADLVSLAADGENLFTGHLNGMIHIWDTNKGEYIAAFDRQRCSITALVFAEGKLFSGSDKGTIKISDMNTGKWMGTFKASEKKINSLVVVDNNLFSGSHDTIKVWNVDTHTCMATFKVYEKGFQKKIHSLAYSEGKLFVGYNIGTIEVWDFKANHNRIFQEIAGLLEQRTPQTTWQALERFSQMPERAKNAIYAKFSEIFHPLTHDYPGCAELIFYDKSQQDCASDDLKAKAIRAYTQDLLR